jgi:hypothetical protein
MTGLQDRGLLILKDSILQSEWRELAFFDGQIGHRCQIRRFQRQNEQTGQPIDKPYEIFLQQLQLKQPLRS